MLPALLLIIPLVGAILIGFLPAQRAKWVAFFASLITFIVSVFVAIDFGRLWFEGGFSETVEIGWLDMFGVTLNMHFDSVSLMLVLLTTMLMPLCAIGSFTAIQKRIREYYVWMLILQTAMVGVFLAENLVFFYICFEFTLVPMFFLIAIYGGDNRARASTKFFIFTFTGSMITLAGLLYVAWQYAVTHGSWDFSIPALTEFASGQMTAQEQAWILLALLSGFAVKVPLFPVHTWLPLAHTEAPTAGSVVLAAVLLKLGTYGLYRFVLPMVPVAVVEYAPVIGVFAIIGILYAALICWVQDDIKKLVAYSSVSHLGFCVLGLFSLNPMGAQGSVLYMLNHGLSTGALFFLVGMIYERYHTRDMNRLGGLSKRMPVWAFFMVFFVLSSVGLPGLNGFTSEFLCLIGAFTASADAVAYPGMFGPWYAAVAALGMIFAAMYLLIMVGKVVFGPLKEPAVDDSHAHGPKLPPDLTKREICVLVPLALLCIYIGFQPKTLTDAIEPSVEHILSDYPAMVREANPVEPAAQIETEHVTLLTDAAAEEDASDG